MELLLQNSHFRVHMGNDVSSWQRQANGLPQGSVLHLALTLFNLYTSDLPVTRSRRFIYADDICCALQVETFSEIECTLTADLAKYNQLWRLKPSTSKTVTSVIHLHNNRSRRELNVHMNGQRLKHDLYPVYLGVTLDRTLSYREYLSPEASTPYKRWSKCTMKKNRGERFLQELSLLRGGSVLPSVLCRCWLGGRKGIRPVKN